MMDPRREELLIPVTLRPCLKKMGQCQPDTIKPATFRDNSRAGLSGAVGVYFNLNEHVLIHEARNSNHRGCGTYLIEELLVGPRNVCFVRHVRKVETRANHIIQGEPSLLKGATNDAERFDRLTVGIAHVPELTINCGR